MTNQNRPSNIHAPSSHINVLFLAVATPLAAAQTRGVAPQYNYEFSAKFNLELTVIVVVVVLAFFFIGFFSVYVNQCVENSDGANPLPSGTAAVESRSRRTSKGLDLSVIDTFPIFIYSDIKQLKIGKGVLECAVCISEFEDSETLRLLPRCDHVFHPQCIDAWLASHSTCPVCRANLSVNELGGDSERDAESIRLPSEQSSRPELSEAQNQVSMNVEDDRARNSRVTAQKYWRSHSTGHSVVQSGENWERYTLRLPEEVRKHIVILKRSMSCVVVS